MPRKSGPPAGPFTVSTSDKFGPRERFLDFSEALERAHVLLKESGAHRANVVARDYVVTIYPDGEVVGDNFVRRTMREAMAVGLEGRR